MSLFTALRDGRYFRNDKARKTRTARRSLDTVGSSPSRVSRTHAISLVEMLEARELMAAYVSTDQLDYAPGSVATFTATNDTQVGANFDFDGVNGPEVIEFQVIRTDGIQDYANGNIP